MRDSDFEHQLTITINCEMDRISDFFLEAERRNSSTFKPTAKRERSADWVMHVVTIKKE